MHMYAPSSDPGLAHFLLILIYQQARMLISHAAYQQISQEGPLDMATWQH